MRQFTDLENHLLELVDTEGAIAFLQRATAKTRREMRCRQP